MTQGTQKVLGGTPYKRYPDPNVKGSANEFGLYPWSVFKAPLCDYQPDYNGAPIPFEGLNGQVRLLLFTSDVPARLELRTTDTGVLSGSALQFSAPVENTLTSLLVTEPGGSTPATITKQGQVLFGYTGDSGRVYCSGFPAFAEAVAPGGGAATYTEVICFANSPVISSPVGALSLSFDQAGSNAFTPVPVIINNYTAAIRDAGNLIKLSDGSLYQVVGLFTN